ncbi:unnamed protein product [Rotaria sp. Silwood2]|nr:unnamed protein product [Rotaria sp. Silwood2]CAF4374015.1 unnamed protein product [Rotaria sp. Silwood2]
MLVFDPVTMPVISSILRYHTLLLVTPKYVCSWLQSNYNITLPFECPQSNPLKLLMHKLYFPVEARLGSFIIGAMVAIKIAQVSHEQSQYSTWKKFFIFNMIFLYSLLTVTQRLDSPNISEFALNFTIATSRTILAISVAFILFTALCPPMHPYHAPWIRRFLSSRIWIPISKLSYLVYLIHWPITFEMVFGGPLLFLKKYSVSYALIISLPIILFISQIVSCIWFLLIEKPFERFVLQHLNTKKSKKIH